MGLFDLAICGLEGQSGCSRVYFVCTGVHRHGRPLQAYGPSIKQSSGEEVQQRSSLLSKVSIGLRQIGFLDKLSRKHGRSRKRLVEINGHKTKRGHIPCNLADITHQRPGQQIEEEIER